MYSTQPRLINFYLLNCLIISLVALPLSAKEKPVTITGSALDRAVVDAYLTGRSLGFEKVAELNLYPKPEKVLTLQQELGLDTPQINRAKMLHKLMRKYAIKAGREIVRKERQLYQLLGQEDPDLDKAHELVKEIGELQADVRFEHIKAAVSQKQFLSETQIDKYLSLESKIPDTSKTVFALEE